MFAHAQWRQFCLKWTAAWNCPVSTKVDKHSIQHHICSIPWYINPVPLCIVGTMLGHHHYPNAEKSQQLINYVEDYLECVESLPLDIQRNVSLLREIDSKYQGKTLPCSTNNNVSVFDVLSCDRLLTRCAEMVCLVYNHFANPTATPKLRSPIAPTDLSVQNGQCTGWITANNSQDDVGKQLVLNATVHNSHWFSRCYRFSGCMCV